MLRGCFVYHVGTEERIRVCWLGGGTVTCSGKRWFFLAVLLCWLSWEMRNFHRGAVISVIFYWEWINVSCRLWMRDVARMAFVFFFSEYINIYVFVYRSGSTAGDFRTRGEKFHESLLTLTGSRLILIVAPCVTMRNVASVFGVGYRLSQGPEC